MGDKIHLHRHDLSDIIIRQIDERRYEILMHVDKSGHERWVLLTVPTEQIEEQIRMYKV